MVAAETVKLRGQVKRLTSSFERLKAKNEALCKALDRSKVKIGSLGGSVAESRKREKCLAEILRAISGSRTDAQPVFDAIADAALRLIGNVSAAVTRLDGDTLHLAALTSTSKMGDERLKAQFPCPVSKLPGHARAIRSRVPYWYSDVQKTKKALPDIARARGFRSAVFVPLLRGGTAIGTIAVTRREPGPFSDHDIDLLKTFADQAVIAIENVRQFDELQARNAELTESLAQQTATSEILRVISSSPTDLQPVFDAILEKGTQLCDSHLGILGLYDGEHYQFVSVRTGIRDVERWAMERGPFRTQPDSPLSRCLRQGQTINIADVKETIEYRNRRPMLTRLVDQVGVRSHLQVPMLKDGRVVGSINIYRPEAGQFTQRQVELVSTFANQAVIAIENVRLFRELQARNAELTQSLEQQTATSEVLKIISRSTFDLQPVLHALVDNAARLCRAHRGVLFRQDGEVYRLAASYNATSELLVFNQTNSIVPGRGSMCGRAMLERQAVHVDDVLADPDYQWSEAARVGNYRTVLGVPLLREGIPIGAMGMMRDKVEPFSTQEIALVTTFADQAVIAIENVRLFNELQARNVELTEALEQQTATAEILKVISSSPTDLQPVFDAILANATRLCDAHMANLWLYDDDQRILVGQRGGSAEYVNWAAKSGPIQIVVGGIVARVIAERQPIQVVDLRESPRYLDRTAPATVALVELGGARSHVLVPMLKEDRVVGSISIYRPEVRPFTQQQIDLVSTFANQAVIAIENVRLFKELQAQTEALSRSVKQLTALGEVGQAISSSLDLETVLRTIVSRALLLTGLDSGTIYEYDPQAQVFRLQAAENMPQEVIAPVRDTPVRMGDGVIGRIGVAREVTQVPDILDASYQSTRRADLVRAGYRALLAVPLLRDEHLMGVLLVHRKSPGAFSPETVELLKTFATQSALAIQNARLFREIAEKGRQLEAASQHKSQFLASMSHELRTPLNAILGFNEMMLDGLYGELPEDLKDPLQETQTSGRHLLRLINNVLDLAKIEAGRMELALADYSVEDMVESVRSTLRPLAEAKGLQFHTVVPSDLPLAYGDAGRLTQSLINLAGNSLKFTKAGQVAISVAAAGDVLAFRVADTGIGIAPEKIGSLFTEFKQTDATIASEYGGTGLGLAITRQFIEMHGGRIWVESELGKGSTFIFEIPLRAQAT